MIDVPFHCFESLDIGHICLSKLLDGLLEFKKTVVIKSLKCANDEDSDIADKCEWRSISS